LAGAPGISKALLAQRLELLEAHAILIKETNVSGRGHIYSRTDQGHELKALTDAMGSWGARWLELQPHDIDAAYVLWATCELVDLSRVPSQGLVARIDLADRPKERFWMLIKRSHAEVCSTYPGGNEDLFILTDSEILARWHLRHLTYEEAGRTGWIRVEGARSARKAFLDCIRPSPRREASLSGSQRRHLDFRSGAPPGRLRPQPRGWSDAVSSSPWPVEIRTKDARNVGSEFRYASVSCKDDSDCYRER
jgi:hypothetical protein